MIQRIQSIYLFIIVILSISLFIFPFQVNIANFSTIIPIKLSFIENLNTMLWVSAILNIIIIVSTAFNIFSYKNRPLQMKLCNLSLILSIILLISMYYGASQIEGIPTYRLPFIFPVLNTILSLLARYYIHKDEELVKSADRIR